MSNDQRSVDISEFQERINDWVAEIDKLQARAAEAKGEMKTEIQNRVDELRKKEKSARESLQNSINAGEDAWKELKRGVEQSFSDLNDSVNRARERLKKEQ